MIWLIIDLFFFVVLWVHWRRFQTEKKSYDKFFIFFSRIISLFTPLKVRHIWHKFVSAVTVKSIGSEDLKIFCFSFLLVFVLSRLVSNKREWVSVYPTRASCFFSTIHIWCYFFIKFCNPWVNSKFWTTRVNIFVCINDFLVFVSFYEMFFFPCLNIKLLELWLIAACRNKKKILHEFHSYLLEITLIYKNYRYGRLSFFLLYRTVFFVYCWNMPAGEKIRKRKIHDSFGFPL